MDLKVPQVIEQDKPVLAWSPHPMMSSEGRELMYAPFLQGETLLQYLSRSGILQRMEATRQPFALTINGQFLPREMWAYCRPKPGTLINVYAVMHGSREGGKNPLQIIATIAVMAFAAWAGPAMFPASSFAATATTLTISTIGGILLNRLFPLPKPRDESEGVSPTYDISGGSNRMRRYEPMPKIVGRHKVVPDLSTQPFTEFRGEDQILYQVFDFGYNDVVLSDFKIGDTPIDNFTGVTLEESGYDGVIRSFPGNVDTIAGGELKESLGFVERTTSVNTVRIGIEISGLLHGIDDKGRVQDLGVRLEMQYRPTGTLTWVPLQFKSDSVPEIYKNFDGSQFAFFGQIQLRDEYQAQQDDPATLLIRHGKRTPLRRTYYFNVPEGQYDVRVRRVTEDVSPNSKTQVSQTVWSQLRSYQKDTADYTGRKRVGLIIRATGQINGVVDQFNCIASARCDVRAANQYADSVLFDGPLAYWRLGEPNGTTAADASGNGHTGTYVGSVVLGTPTGIFDETDTAMTLPGGTVTEYFIKSAFPFPKKYVSVEFWVKCTGSGDGIFSYESGSNEFVVFGQAALQLYVKGQPFNTAVNIADDQWHYVVVTWNSDSGNLRLYVDGDLETNTIHQKGAVLSTGGTIVLGQDQDSVGGSFDSAQAMPGSFDEVAVYDFTLSPEQIAERWKVGTTGWAKQETSNPAWWGRDIAKGKFIGTRRVWGAGLPDSRIDDANIVDFAAWCTAEGLEFNGVFDQQISVFDMYSAVVLAGLGTPSWATGKLGVVWDAPNLPIVAVFGMQNIIPGTFQISYATEELADVIEAEFINPELGWQTDFVKVNVPGATESVRVRRVHLFGCTDKDLAGLHANAYAAQNAFRNRRYKWQTDFEGMPAARGDVIQLSHDLASLDFSGRFIEGGDSSTLKLTRKVPLIEVTGSFIVIVRPDGQFATFDILPGTGETDTVSLLNPLEGVNDIYNPYGPDRIPYDYKWLYGATATPGKKLKIESFKPLSERVVEISAFDERAEFYLSRDGGYTYVPPRPVFGAAPTITNVELTPEGISSGNSYVVRVRVTWDASGDYTFADVRFTTGDASPEMFRQNISGTVYDEIIVEDGATVTVEITAYGNTGRLGQSTKVTVTETIDFASSSPPSDVLNFVGEITPAGIHLTWDEIPDADKDQYEIWRGAAFGSGEMVFLGKVHEFVDVPKTVGTYNYYIKAIDVAEIYSENATHVEVVINSIGAPAFSPAVIEESDVVLSWTPPIFQFAVDTYEVRFGASWATGISVGKTKSTTLKVPVNWVGNRTFWVAAYDIAGNEGAQDSVTVNVAAAIAPTVSGQIVGENTILSWNAPSSTLPIKEYEIRHGASYAGGTFVTRIKGTTHTLKVNWSGSRTFWVAAYDVKENEGAAGSTAINVTAPSAPTVTFQVVDNNVLFQWTDTTQTLPIDTYELRRGPSFATADVIGTVKARFDVIFETEAGEYTYWIVGIDTAGNYGSETGVTATVSQPPDFTLFDDKDSHLDSTSQTNWLRTSGRNYVVPLNGSTQYGQVLSVPDLDSGITGLTFEAWVIYNGSDNGGIIDKTVGGATNSCALLFIEGTNARMRVDLGAGGLQTASVSLAGFSAGTPLHLCGRWDGTNVKIQVNAGAVQSVAAAGTLDQGAGVLYFGRLGTGADYFFNGSLAPTRIYKRAISDTEVGEHYHGIFKNETSIVGSWNFSTGSGGFVFDDTDNSYDIDLVGDASWALHALDGRNDLTLGSSKAYYPVHSQESVQEYITRTGYATPQAATTAGDDTPLKGAPTTAQYVEIIDFGTVIPSTKIILTLTRQALYGSVTVTPTISYRKTPSDPWIDHVGVFTVFATDFQYVKITLNISGAGGANVESATLLNTRLDVKLSDDAGTAEIFASDAASGGTEILFNRTFIDIQSITATPLGTASVKPVVNFVDAPNPTSFKILLFNDSGVAQNGNVSWAAKGV